MPKPPPDAILAAIDRINPVDSRASLTRWMRANHDALLARIGDKRPDWTALAKVFADAGLRDRTGKPASPDTCRAAWFRVRRSVAAGRARQAAKPRLPPRAPDPTPPPAAEEAEDVLPRKPVFKPVAPRKD